MITAGVSAIHEPARAKAQPRPGSERTSGALRPGNTCGCDGPAVGPPGAASSDSSDALRPGNTCGCDGPALRPGGVIEPGRDDALRPGNSCGCEPLGAAGRLDADSSELPWIKESPVPSPTNLRSGYRATATAQEAARLLERWRGPLGDAQHQELLGNMGKIGASRAEIKRFNTLMAPYVSGSEVHDSAQGGRGPLWELPRPGRSSAVELHTVREGKMAVDRGHSSDEASAGESVVACGMEVSFHDSEGSCGYFEFVADDPIPEDYSPTIDADTRREVMDLVSGLWYDSDDWHFEDSADVSAMVHEWDVSKSPGLFINDGWGPPFKVFKYALGLIDIFRDFIPNSGADEGADCPNAQDKVADRLDKGKYRFFVNREGGTCESGSVRDGISFCSPSNRVPEHVSVSVKTLMAEHPTIFSRTYIRICPETLCAAGAAMDHYLFQAARRYFYVKEGRAANLVSAATYAFQAIALGRLSDAGIADLAHVLLHEMFHVEFAGSHCHRGCCFQRMSLKWWCRTFSFLGLYGAGIGISADLKLEGDVTPSDSSVCDDVHQATFSGGCAMDHPGTTGNEEAFFHTLSSDDEPHDWENPEGCS